VLSPLRFPTTQPADEFDTADYISRMRGSPRLLALPPYISALCMLGGVIWILLLPLQQYSRQTYISENALLPGQVHTYFGGSEQDVFRAYKHEVARMIVQPWTTFENGTRLYHPLKASDDDRRAKFQELFRNAGLKTAAQAYEYESSGTVYRGNNVYGVLHAPRGDGTEAIVLMAPIRNIDNELNLQGVTLLISLARYFKRWSLWSKDIIFLITPDSKAGPQAWVDAYFSQHDPTRVAGLPLKSGALQGAVGIDFPFEHRFESFSVAYDGVNGQLPNLDLFNTAVSIASGQMHIAASIQGQHHWAKKEQYSDWSNRVRVLGRGMLTQAVGQATGPHSVFMPYHIDAVTLTAIGDGWQDEMAFGRTVESITRSLNNLLEKLHQSFFFYLLMQSNRFVSIGTYLPSAMAVAAAYTVMAIYLWVMSGYNVVDKPATTAAATPNGKAVAEKKGASSSTVQASENKVPSPASSGATREFNPVPRSLTLPLTLLTTTHLLSIIPLYALTRSSQSTLLPILGLLSLASLVFPASLAGMLKDLPAHNATLLAFSRPTTQQYRALKSLSLLLLGLFLTVLATLNFSLSMFLGLACAPIAFVDRVPGRSLLAATQYLLLLVFSPVGVAVAAAGYASQVLGQQEALDEWLVRFAFGWNVWGNWGVPLGVFCVWWPAWTVAATVVASSWFQAAEVSVQEMDVLKKGATPGGLEQVGKEKGNRKAI
jgi:GPI-anchor transamidase subunit GAA1